MEYFEVDSGVGYVELWAVRGFFSNEIWEIASRACIVMKDGNK